MTKREQKRIDALLPGGIPRWVRIYDSAGTPNETCDRYSVVFTGCYTRRTGGYHLFVSMNGAPYHPQGICMHGEDLTQCDIVNGHWPPSIGRKCHLGKRIVFADLPEDCKKVVLHDYCLLWEIPHPATGVIPHD